MRKLMMTQRGNRHTPVSAGRDGQGTRQTSTYARVSATLSSQTIRKKMAGFRS